MLELYQRLLKKVQVSVPTRFRKIFLNFCYLESYYLAEIIISTGVPNPLEVQYVLGLTGIPPWVLSGSDTGVGGPLEFVDVRMEWKAVFLNCAWLGPFH